MIKKRLSLMLTAVMVFALTVPNLVFGFDYSDHWAKDTIQEWFDKERIKGYEDGSFQPQNPITRAEFMTMVNSAYNFTELADIDFSDVEEVWYYVEVQKAVKAGYIVGDDGNTVRPTDAITRQEVAAIITRLNELEQNSDVSMFADKADIAEWAVEYVGAVKEAGYMIGNDENKFNAKADITRAEALITLDRAMNDSTQYASIAELSIEGAELGQSFDSNTTTYTAIAAAGVTEVTIVADVTTNAAINFTSNVVDSEVEVTTASAIEGGVVYTASVALSNSDSTVVTMTVSEEGMEDRVYTLTITKEELTEEDTTEEETSEVVSEDQTTEEVTQDVNEEQTAVTE